jgi:armadillo repeat-containing protein 1
MQTPAHSFFKGKVNKMARTLLLQIDGLNDLNARQLLEQHLLRVKGVVSFTFDMKTGRVTVRVRDWLKIEVGRVACVSILRAGS